MLDVFVKIIWFTSFIAHIILGPNLKKTKHYFNWNNAIYSASFKMLKVDILHDSKFKSITESNKILNIHHRN